MIGTQFHPEAYAEGMYDYFNQEDRKNSVIAEHGEERLIRWSGCLPSGENITH